MRPDKLQAQPSSSCEHEDATARVAAAFDAIGVEELEQVVLHQVTHGPIRFDAG